MGLLRAVLVVGGISAFCGGILHLGTTLVPGLESWPERVISLLASAFGLGISIVGDRLGERRA